MKAYGNMENLANIKKKRFFSLYLCHSVNLTVVGGVAAKLTEADFSQAHCANVARTRKPPPAEKVYA